MCKMLRFAPLAALLMLGACAAIPSGPSVMALPGTGRSFDQFRDADADCRRFAFDQIGGMAANQAAIDSGAQSVVLGTALGALAGAAINGQHGAGVGAGLGLLLGSAASLETGQAATYDSQRRYDNAYIQCMYAKGDRVPVAGARVSGPTGNASPRPSSHPLPPPPPPGYPPPPPPGVRPFQ